MKHIIPLIVLLTMTSTAIMAQNKKPFTLEDLIPGGKSYYANTPQNEYYEWWGDILIRLDMEKAVCVVENHKVLVGANTEKKLFSLDEINSILKSANKRQIQHLYSTQFPYPGQTIAQFTLGAENLLVDWTAKKVIWSQTYGRGAENVDWHSSSRNVAYTINHNLLVQKSDGETIKVSTDGSIDLVYGETVHRDEFGISKGTYWSPSGKLLAFYRMDQSMVTSYPQVDISARTAIKVDDKYPMAGEASHKVTVGVFDTETRKTIYLDAGDPTDRYFTNIAWSPDEKHVYVIELNRDQNHAQLVSYNASTGKKESVLFDEINEKYVEPMNPIQFLPWDNGKFIYLTRKDGYLHIYLYEATGKQLAQLTKGEFEVISVLGFNKEKHTIVYTSNEKHPLQQNVYSVDMKGKRLLLDDGEGWHTAVISASGHMFIDTYSSPSVARNIDVRATDGKAKAYNLMTSPEPWDKFIVPEMKVGTIKAADGKTDLYYRLVLPSNFDPNKKYPAVIYVYGGPHAHNVDASRHWGVRGWDIWMAQNGYVMLSVDNRGSEHRGLEFEQATFRQLGVEEMKDQLQGVEFLKSLPYVDPERLGVHGWSFGGFMTTSLMTTYPDVFKVGVAGGPVIDWKYYEVMYGERYMDTPQSNPEGYAKASLLNKAGNLKGRLLVIYGGNDPVCVPQHTLSFMRACIDAGTYPDLFTYPGDGHNMQGSDRIHLHHKITQYFNDYLK